MAKRILILTEPGDTHAYAVSEALRRKGAKVSLWHTTDFPSRSGESILIGEKKKVITLQSPQLELTEHHFDTIWNRRPAYVVDEAKLHPADRKFTDLECNIFRRSLLSLLDRNSFWVNPADAATHASRKPVQQDTAIEVGLETPDSLYTNDPQEIRKFIADQGGTIIYKPFRAITWKDEETYWLPYTSLITADSLVRDELLSMVPGIYQALIPKAYELRVTVMGNRAIAARVNSQDTQTGQLDWRKSYHELQMEAYNLPPEIAERCSALLARLGLVFGCFDFIVTPDGRYIFLEVNEMGQFLFVEHYTKIPLLDAFSEFLIQGTTAFKWSETQAILSLASVEEEAEEMSKRFRQGHVVRPESAIWEGSEE
jgi:glutathione synthase/RimK-type ligase-like ATP-grasp enzyme